jgi:large subunit ribosomal protein L1
MGARRPNTKPDQQDEAKPIVVSPTVSTGDDATAAPVEKKETKRRRQGPRRSAKYMAVRGQVDKTKLYETSVAIDLVKKLSYSSFPGTLVAHLVLREVGMSGTVTLPHSTGKTIRVAIVTDDLLQQIAAGELNFDVLLAPPQFMPKLAKVASILGPKGLMPNPKNGTLTPNPELAKQKLEGGAMTVRTEKKAPLMHIALGKTSMDTKHLAENLDTLMKSLKGKLLAVSIAASMSPSVKVQVVE